MAVALLGWFVADRLYRQRPTAGQLAAAYPAGYKLLANKYYVDEFYGATIVRPLLALSKFMLEWVVDVAILGGLAWLLGGIAMLSGAILQRWQSGNLRSYAAWLAAGAAALLLFVLVPWATVLASLQSFTSAWRDTEMNEINNSILTLILLVPLAGAVLVALAPDRAKLPNWIALLTALVTFGLTLHLPAHFVLGQAAFSLRSIAPGSKARPFITTLAWMASASGWSSSPGCSRPSAS